MLTMCDNSFCNKRDDCKRYIGKCCKSSNCVTWVNNDAKHRHLNGCQLFAKKATF